MPATGALSQRELEVLAFVVRGASNKEAARNLRISEATIKSHLLRIFRKLGVEDRTAAVTVALERGLLRLTQQLYVACDKRQSAAFLKRHCQRQMSRAREPGWPLSDCLR